MLDTLEQIERAVEGIGELLRISEKQVEIFVAVEDAVSRQNNVVDKLIAVIESIADRVTELEKEIYKDKEIAR